MTKTITIKVTQGRIWVDGLELNEFRKRYPTVNEKNIGPMVTAFFPWAYDRNAEGSITISYEDDGGLSLYELLTS
jgi:hypothetical protein